MKSVQYILIIVFVSAICSCKETVSMPDCNKYKTGIFLYKVRSEENPSDIIIIRNDSLQTEVVKNTGDTGVLRVTWINECSYELKYIKTISERPDSLTFFKKAITIQTTILGGTDNYYLFEAKNNTNSFVLRDTIWISR